MSRERDVRLAIGDALVDTGAVDTDAVRYCALAEAILNAPIVVTIEPVSTSLAASGGMSTGQTFGRTAFGFDGPIQGQLLYTGRAQVGIQSTDPEMQARDEAMEAVLMNLCNAVNGKSLADITFPADTLVASWKWQDATSTRPRALLADVRYTFLIDGWEGFDTTP